MSQRLSALLIELAKDFEPSKVEPMMAAAGLSEEEKEAVRSGDSRRIQQLVGGPRGWRSTVCMVAYFKSGFKIDPER